MTFSGGEMSDLRAYQGGLLYVESYATTVPFVATSLTINRIKSYSDGGGIVLKGSTAQTFTFTTVTINTCISETGEGGFMYVDNAL